MDALTSWLHQTRKVSPNDLDKTLAGLGAAGWECAGIAPSALVVWSQNSAYADGSRPATVTEYVVVLRQPLRR